MSKQICTYCSKDCKPTDSRPYPNSKSTDRMHNRCFLKKSIEESRLRAKNPTDADKDSKTDHVYSRLPSSSSSSSTATDLLEKLSKEQASMSKAANERTLNKLTEAGEIAHRTDKNTGQFFFDLKAGIAKPHEKRRFLHHRSVSEIAPRYDDQGFRDQDVSGTVDIHGHDLTELDDNVNKVDELNQEVNHDGQQNSNEKSDQIKRKRRKDTTWRASKIKIDDQNSCWFCLSSPNVEKHLIIAIGEYCYLALAKGGLTDDHFLLMPIEHINCINSQRNSFELLQELDRFKGSLVEYFKASGRDVVFFERNYKSIHWQLQAVPVKPDPSLMTKIKTISRRHYKSSNFLELPKDCSLRYRIPNESLYYLYWEIEPLGVRMVTQIQDRGAYFPVQIARMVLSDESILDCANRVDWKACVKTRDEYVELAKSTKELYADFDIT